MPEEINATNLGPIEPNSLIIVKLAGDDAIRNMRMAQEFSKRLIEARHGGAKVEGVTVLMLRPEDSIEKITETQMNENGWCRVGKATEMQDIATAAVVEIDTAKNVKRLWVNVDGKCALRCSNIAKLVIRER